MTDTNADKAETDGGAARSDAAPPEDAGIPPEEVEPTPPSEEPDSGRADPDAFFVPRDETGAIAHVETTAEGYGTVVVQPMVYGEVEKYLGDAGAVAQADAETVSTILRNHIVEPDLDEYAKANFRDEVEAARRGQDGPAPGVWFTADLIRDHMNPYAPQALLMAVLRESGMDVNVGVDQSGEATIEFDDEGN